MQSSHAKGAPGEDASAHHRPVINRHIYVPHYLHLIANAVTSGGSRIYLEKFGVGLNEGRIAAVLGHVPGMTAAELGVAMAMNKSIVSRSLWTMLDRGLVHQTGTERARRNWLTEAGAELEAGVVRVSLAREKLLLEGFSVEEKAVLLSFLGRMQANLAKMAGFETS
jgi:DNA-binding MarR family transcriptional regulator